MLLSYQTEIQPMDTPGPHEGLSALTDDAERNRLLAEMAEQSTDMISRHTPGDWHFIYASPAVENLLGYSVDEIIGMSAYELYHPDDVEDFKRRSPSVSYERGLYTHTYRFRCKDGHYTWLESTSRSLRDPATGELKEILVVSRDASRRIEAEQTNRRLARVLESSSDLVAFIDLDNRVSNLNEAARERLGVVAPVVDNSDRALILRDLFHPQSYQQLLDEALPTAETEGQWRGDAEMCDRDGKAIPVMLEVLAHRTFTDQIEYFSVVARDMSAQKAMEAERQQYQAEVSHTSRLVTMGEMASGLAHELNQPLTAIVNYVSGIERRVGQQNEIAVSTLEKPLKRISATALRAGEIIRRMMDFARKGQTQRETVQVKALVSEVMDFCASSAGRSNVQLENRIPDNLSAVMADRIQLEQILLNLLLNAIEASASDEEAEPLRVWVDASESAADQVIIQVHDQGRGLPQTDTEQLFEQFFTTKDSGLGMGLAISRSLVEAHGGQLWAENARMGGAVFSFSLTRA
ncbi:PAS domain S-box protein [Pontibacterium sp.]|uniref:PAS domain-containing sensor histidine kinase n=1 Tax=Pontibacterium sp. TaxID=2036026 RepID=UPI00356A0A72